MGGLIYMTVTDKELWDYRFKYFERLLSRDYDVINVEVFET